MGSRSAAAFTVSMGCAIGAGFVFVGNGVAVGVKDGVDNGVIQTDGVFPEEGVSIPGFMARHQERRGASSVVVRQQGLIVHQVMKIVLRILELGRTGVP